MKIFYSLLLMALVACNGGGADNTHKLGNADTTLKWIDYREGELPPLGYYDAMDSVIKKWGIRYERIEGGCEVIPAVKRKQEQNNPAYFRVLEKQFGKDWRRRFDQEVNELEPILHKADGHGAQ